MINSFLFHNPMYLNPKVNEVMPVNHRKPIHAGAYVLDNTIELHGTRDIFMPHNEQVMEYANTSMSESFKYTRKGIFYREYERGTIGKILNFATFFDLGNMGRFDYCTPGDTRVWFEYFAPKSLTVLGKKKGDMITSTVFEGYKIGAALSSDESLSKIVKANFSCFPTIMKWLLRVVLLFIIFTGYESMFASFLSLGLVIFVECFAYQANISDFISRWYKNLLASCISGIVMYLLRSLIIPECKERC